MEESKNLELELEHLRNILKNINSIDLLIKITTSHTLEERMKIKEKYYDNYKENLIENIKNTSFLDDNFKELIIALYTDKYNMMHSS